MPIPTLPPTPSILYWTDGSLYSEHKTLNPKICVSVSTYTVRLQQQEPPITCVAMVNSFVYHRLLPANPCPSHNSPHVLMLSLCCVKAYCRGCRLFNEHLERCFVSWLQRCTLHVVPQIFQLVHEAFSLPSGAGKLKVPCRENNTQQWEGLYYPVSHYPMLAPAKSWR